MPIAALLLGSNMGDKKKNLETANRLINERTGNVIKRSTIYKTEPWGLKEQPEFFNQSILVETKLSPSQLLKELLRIEIEAGRVRTEKWGSRELDIDILYYDDLIVNDESLKIPHPFLSQRRFSLIPLNEISPHWVHPLLKQNTFQLLENCPDEGKVLKADV